MPGRPIWSGTVSFGMVVIPVKLHSALRSQSLPFHIMHEKDHARLRRKMFCPEHNIIVHPEHMLRGYEVENGKYVTVRDDELEALEPKRSQSIEIIKFVKTSEIPPQYYDRPYYLEPDKGGDKPFFLLTKTMAENKTAGVAKFVMRAREYLSLLMSISQTLVLMKIHYNHDIIDGREIMPEVKAEKKDVDMISDIIQDMQTDFVPEHYADDYSKRVLQLIEEKQKKHEVFEQPTLKEEEIGEELDESADLLEALEKSLQKG